MHETYSESTLLQSLHPVTVSLHTLLFAEEAQSASVMAFLKHTNT